MEKETQSVAKELRRATNNYDQRQSFLQDIDYEFFKGYLQDHLISVKKFRDEEIFVIKDIALEDILNDIVHMHWNFYFLLFVC